MKKINNLKYFNSPQSLVDSLAVEFKKLALDYQLNGQLLNIAISGGNTPKLFFQTLASTKYNLILPWFNIHFFWVDERCVSPDNIESNYKMAKDTLLDKIDIPPENIHRIHGEEVPHIEVEKYSNEILKYVTKNEFDWPSFDWIFLGLGMDGHTASIFPDSDILTNRSTICDIGNHPVTNQNRITMTIPTINHAKRITFIVTGKSKASILKNIISSKRNSKKYPATFVFNKGKSIDWYVDSDAAEYLKSLE